MVPPKSTLCPLSWESPPQWHVPTRKTKQDNQLLEEHTWPETSVHADFTSTKQIFYSSCDTENQHHRLFGYIDTNAVRRGLVSLISNGRFPHLGPHAPTLKRACNSATPDIVLANRQGNLNYHNHRHCPIHQPNHGPYTFPRDPRRFPLWCILFTNHASLYILYSFCCCCFHFHHKCSKTMILSLFILVNLQ